MVIPMNSGPPLMGAPPPEVVEKMAQIKMTVIGLFVLLVLQVVSAGALDGSNLAMTILQGSLSFIMNLLCGIFLLKDDPSPFFNLQQVYQCLVGTCCAMCAECGSGMTCLQPYMMVSFLNAFLTLLLPGGTISIVNYVNSRKDANLIAGYICIASTILIIVVQVAGGYIAYTAYKIARDMGPGEPMGGGQWSQGGGGGGGFAPYTPQSNPQRQEARQEARPAANFTPFAGGGQRLGG